MFRDVIGDFPKRQGHVPMCVMLFFFLLL